MPIPQFDPNGFLPEGVYECSLEELRERFGGGVITVFLSRGGHAEQFRRLRFAEGRKAADRELARRQRAEL